MQKKYAHFLVLYAHKNNIIAYLLYWYKFGIIFLRELYQYRTQTALGCKLESYFLTWEKVFN